MVSRIMLNTILSMIAISIAFLLIASPLYTQEEKDSIELLPPNYVNSEYKFGIALPKGYKAFSYSEGDFFFVEMVGNFEQASARLSIEPLPSDVTDFAGFWQAVKERDKLMKRSITYERVTSVADCGAIQARIERFEGADYILAITWAWVHDNHGYILTAYPPAEGDNNLARDLAEQLVKQFRWMSDEEIAEALESMPQETEKLSLPPGQEF